MPELNPDRLSPEDLAQRLGPFGSWNADGSLPAGVFLPRHTEKASCFYRDWGYVVIHDALQLAELEQLKLETQRLCRNEDGLVDGVVPADANMGNDEAMARVLCVHFPNKLSSRIEKALSHPAVVDTLRHLIGPNLKCMQSMLFVKASGKLPWSGLSFLARMRKVSMKST